MKEKVTEEQRFENIQKSKWSRVMNAIFDMLVINIYVFLFTCLGFIVFGIAPALYSGYYILASNDGYNLRVNMFSDFWQVYKQKFIKANIGFYTIGVILFVFIKSFVFYKNANSLIALIILYVMGALFILFMTTVISLPTVCVKYEQKSFYDKLRISFYMIFIKPSAVLKIIFLLPLAFIFLLLFPQFLIFFCFSLPLYITYYPVNKFINELLLKNSEQEA